MVKRKNWPQIFQKDSVWRKCVSGPVFFIGIVAQINLPTCLYLTKFDSSVPLDKTGYKLLSTPTKTWQHIADINFALVHFCARVQCSWGCRDGSGGVSMPVVSVCWVSQGGQIALCSQRTTSQQDTSSHSRPAQCTQNKSMEQVLYDEFSKLCTSYYQQSAASLPDQIRVIRTGQGQQGGTDTAVWR